MHKHGTILALSGLESRRLLDTFADMGAPHIQVSYYYLRKVFAVPEDFQEYAKSFETVFLDHGLIYAKFAPPDIERFLEEYRAYIGGLDTSTYHAVVADPRIDLEDIVPSNKLIYPLDSMKDIYEGDIGSVLEQLEYVGVSNKTATNEEEMGYIASQARKHGTKLHAFGTSSIRVLKKWPIYSANSSSWRTGSRYANTYIYEGATRGLRIYQPTDKSDLVKTEREKRVIRTRLRNFVSTRQKHLYELIDWGELFEDNSWEVDKANLTQWLLYQRDLEFYTKNAYWLDEEEKQILQKRKTEVLGTPQEHDIRPPSEESADIRPPLFPRNKEKTYREKVEDTEGYSPPLDIENPELVDAEIISESTDMEPLLDPPNIAPPAKKELRSTRLKEVDPRIASPRKCDFCILAERCPKYEAGAVCAFGITETYLPADMDDHINEDVGELLAIQRDRILQGYLEEKSDASGLSKDVSREMKLYLEMIALYKAANDTRDSLEVKAKGTGILQMFNK